MSEVRLCACGCGDPTPLSTRTVHARRLVKGHPVRFIAGHENRGRFGAANGNWQGGKSRSGNGYALVFQPDSPMADAKGYVYEHRLVMANHLGRALRNEEVVHHRNGDKLDNRLENLRLFASQGDHARFHKLAVA